MVASPTLTLNLSLAFLPHCLLPDVTWVHHLSVGTFCDKAPMVSWIGHMASNAGAPTSGRLLHGLAIIIHQNDMGPLTSVHIPVDDNILVDIAYK